MDSYIGNVPMNKYFMGNAALDKLYKGNDKI